MASDDPNPSTLDRIAARPPRWVSAFLGLACVVLGAHLLARPLTSVSMLVLAVALGFIVVGVADLLDPRAERAGVSGLIVGVAWVTVGVVMLLFRPLAFRILAVAAPVGLVAWGIVRLGAAVRGARGDRLATGLLGAATVIFGLVVLVWPDARFLASALAFGAGLVLFGLVRLWRAVTGPRQPAGPTPRGWLGRSLGLVGAAVALVLAIGLFAAGLAIRASAPVVDDFYAAPADVPAEPGVLLRTEPFAREVPPGASAWRILYTTTRDEGEPVLASALVVTPGGPPGPLLAWAHGTTGFAEQCAPSVLAEPFESGALFVLDRILAEGWTLVATDYLGLGTAGPHSYLIGQGEGRSVLDAVRAARQMGELTLDARTVVWGHSQGGHAALWTGVLAPTYAPELPVAGVAALAPASDLVGLVANLPNVPGGTVFGAYVAASYTQIYPEVSWNDYVRPAASAIVREMSTRCLSGPAVLSSIITALSIQNDAPAFSTDPVGGAFGERVRQNVPPAAVEAPLLIGQGATDPLVPPAVQDAYVDSLCAAGRPVDYRTYADRDHIGVVAADSPLIDELIAWTHERLAGTPPTPTCN